MTIETVVNKTIQTGNGSNKDFDFAFEIPNEDSLSLTKRNADGSETAITSNYTVTGLGDESGGSVNYPTSGSALTSSEKIVIKRVVSLRQFINFRNQGDYSLEDIEDALDYAVMIGQQLQEQIDRAVLLNLSSSQSGVTLDDLIANRLLVVSADGTKIEMSSDEYGSIDAYLSTLVAIADDISTVAGIEADVSAVAAIAADVSAVAAIVADVSALAAIDSEVAALAALATEIAALYANLDDIHNAASFNFPTLSGVSDAEKHLKINATGNGYELVSGDNLNELAGLTFTENKLLALDKDGLLVLRDRDATSTNAGVSLLCSPITIANNASDANNDIDFSAGTFRFSDGSGQAVATAMTKRLDAAWAAGTNQGGLDTGSKANSTWYHCWAIYNPTTLTSDFLFSTSATSPTMPSGYTKKARRGAVKTNSSGDIIRFLQNGSTFIWNSMQLSSAYLYGSYPTTRTAQTVETPTGIITQAILNVEMGSTTASTGSKAILLTNLSQTDDTPDGDSFSLIIASQGSSENENSSGQVLVFTNTSNSIGIRGNSANISSTIVTVGYNDYSL